MKKLTAYWLATLVAMSLGGCKDDGSDCGNGSIDMPEECDDGNTSDGDGCSAACTLEGPAPQTAAFDITCCIADADPSCTMGTPLTIPASLTVQLEEAVTSGATVGYTAEFSASLIADVGQLVLNLTGTDTLPVQAFSFGLTSAGATPADPSFVVSDVPFDIDVDANDDGTAEDTEMSSGPLAGSLTHDGASSEVTFSLEEMAVSLLADTLVVAIVMPESAPATGDAIVYCLTPDPADTTIAIAVE